MSKKKAVQSFLNSISVPFPARDYETEFCNFETEKMRVLLGARIVKILCQPPSFGFVAEKDGTEFVVSVWCDPEGNGPGHLAITQCKSTKRSKSR